ncbi:probable G-protein coupled receptor 139 [Narcine bancroftii]|uniref:probable G-protein coupled receptor 139 n=1 Tax=Narcine bancroftii TaxID=1343680 RepID=UPI0038310EF0
MHTLQTDFNMNGVAIAILSRAKCGLSTCTTRYLVAMAAADLLVVITEVILNRIKYHYIPVCFLDITPVGCTLIALSRAAMDCSVWFTVAFTFDRFVAICCQNFKATYCTGKNAASMLSTTGILLCLKNIPFYFTRKPGKIINNIPWFTKMKLSYFSDPRWVAFDLFATVLTPLLPFVVILLLNALTVRHILLASRVRQSLKGQSKRAKRNDPEMESRRRSIVLLFTLSGSFILLWLTNVLNSIYYQIARSGGKWNDSEIIFGQVGFFLRNVSCCTNTFIYAATQSKFREQVKFAMEYSATAVFFCVRKIAPMHSSQAMRRLNTDGIHLRQIRF